MAGPSTSSTPPAATSPGPKRLGAPDLGCGVGLRIPHYEEHFDKEPRPDIGFVEIISENFLVEGGLQRRNLARARERYAVVPHGVSLGLGAVTELDWDYLARLKELTNYLKPPWISDHFCWSRNAHADLHDLLPMPYTEEAVEHLAQRARVVQDYLGLRLCLENTSSYLSYRCSTLSEWEFVSAVANEADCGLLLDVNNVYVSAYNHGFDPRQFIEHIPHERIMQYHLAGHTNKGSYILDTHDDHVIDEVWSLYEFALERSGPVSTLVEWDDRIPSLDVLQAEANKAAQIRKRLFAQSQTTDAQESHVLQD